MSSFFEKNGDRLEQFTRVSGSVGARADYVQGGGGNTSAKLEGGLMAIKASGYCLKDIRPDKAYAVLDYEALRRFYYGNDPADFEDVEKAGSAQAKEHTKAIEGLAALRPSVEAGFHSLLDTYVAHSHSVYANLAACSRECVDIVTQALKDADYTWGFVRYVNPGARRHPGDSVRSAGGKQPAHRPAQQVVADVAQVKRLVGVRAGELHHHGPAGCGQLSEIGLCGDLLEVRRPVGTGNLDIEESLDHIETGHLRVVLLQPATDLCRRRFGGFAAGFQKGEYDERHVALEFLAGGLHLDQIVSGFNTIKGHCGATRGSSDIIKRIHQINSVPDKRENHSVKAHVALAEFF